MKKTLGVTSVLLVTGFSVFGTTIAPSFSSFGSLGSATFGGTGINNDSVAAYTTIANGNDSITLGLSATPRYSNPALSNSGGGVGGGIFYATPGENTGLDGAIPAHTIGTTWNFDYYINLADNTASDYTFALEYGNNTTGAFNTLNFNPTTPSNTSGTSQDSWNLDMSFLNGIGFNPNANGVYAFELIAYNSTGTRIGDTAINVDVQAVPDSGSTALLLGFGFVGLAAFGFKQNRKALVK